MNKLFFVLAVTLIAASASAFKLSQECENNVLREVRDRSIRMSQKIYEETGHNMHPYVGVACENAAINILDINSKETIVQMVVNPWYGPSDRLKVKCKKSELKDLPKIEVTVQKRAGSNCEIQLTSIEAKFDLND